MEDYRPFGQEPQTPPQPAPRKTDKLVAFYPILLAIALAIGVYFGSQMTAAPSGSQKESASKIVQLLKIIEENYVDEIDRESFTEDALGDILHGLDPHSSYLSTKDTKKAREDLSGNFGGVGIQFLVHKDTLAVTHLIDGGPSKDAGILPFDRIVKVDTTSMAGRKITTDDVYKALRGEVGSKVKVHIKRPGEKKPLEFTLRRGLIPVSSVEVALMADSETGYIRLSQFGETTYKDFLAAVNRLQNRGMKKLILDLRDNGGGLLGEANKIADEFLRDGKMIVYTEGAHQKRRDYTATSKGKLEETPVAVLINQYSASASEIVAGAIQDNDRGLIIGRRSFGKGLVQQDLSPFKDGSSVRLTVSRYYTPTGRSIQKAYGKGIDYELEQYERYEKNELFQADSSIFVDSLKFITPKGKVVYGGGGIMPDIFVPLDTAGRTDYYTRLVYDRTFGEFAFDYVEKNRKQLLAFRNEQNFSLNFDISDALLRDLIAFAAKKGIKGRESELLHSQKLIKNYLKAEIAKLIWNSEGFYSVTIKQDQDVRKALELLRKENTSTAVVK